MLLLVPRPCVQKTKYTLNNWFPLFINRFIQSFLSNHCFVIKSISLLCFLIWKNNNNPMHDKVQQGKIQGAHFIMHISVLFPYLFHSRPPQHYQHIWITNSFWPNNRSLTLIINTVFIHIIIALRMLWDIHKCAPFRIQLHSPHPLRLLLEMCPTHNDISISISLRRHSFVQWLTVWTVEENPNQHNLNPLSFCWKFYC